MTTDYPAGRNNYPEPMASPLFSWHHKRVFLTGHTGFKGGWLALWLTKLGAEVRGYALEPCTDPQPLHRRPRRLARGRHPRRHPQRRHARTAHIHDFSPRSRLPHGRPSPSSAYSYEDPIGTYETNVIGTARVLDAVRRTPSVRAVVSVTTDKCYENKEWVWGYRETDPLGGYDPYSSSKACAEIVSAAFRQSYFHPSTNSIRPGGHHTAIATARAGNVIGGGDWSLDRLIPDLVAGFSRGEPVRIRSPHAIRPWQHVLEPLHGYITPRRKAPTPSPEAARFATAYNFGPAEDDARPVQAGSSKR